MGEPKQIDKQVLRAALVACNTDFTDYDDKSNCQGYVMQCVSQEMEGASKYYQYAESGYNLSYDSFSVCLKFAQYMAGNFGPVGTLPPTVKEVGAAKGVETKKAEPQERQDEDKSKPASQTTEDEYEVVSDEITYEDDNVGGAPGERLQDKVEKNGGIVDSHPRAEPLKEKSRRRKPRPRGERAQDGGFVGGIPVDKNGNPINEADKKLLDSIMK